MHQNTIKPFRVIILVLVVFLDTEFQTKRVFSADLSKSDKLSSIVALNAAVDEWFEGVTFRSTYELKKGTAENEHKAFQGIFDKQPKVINGEFNKDKNNKIRISRIYDSPPTIISKGPSGRKVTDVGSDEVSIGSLALSYNPTEKSSQLAGTCGIGKKMPELSIGILGAGSSSYKTLGPLSCMSIRYKFLEVFDESDENDNKLPKFAIIHNEDNRITISLEIDHPTYEETVEIKFWTEPNIPVIEEYSILQNYPDGDFTQSRVKAENFIDCDGFMVPRLIRLFLKGASGDEGMLVEWKSNDLGQQRPINEDFVVKIPTDVTIFGLKEQPVSENGYFTIDLGKLSEADLRIPNKSLPKIPREFQEHSILKSRWLILGGINFILLLLLFLWFKSKSVYRDRDK